jgi:hypothetical protein
MPDVEDQTTDEIPKATDTKGKILWSVLWVLFLFGAWFIAWFGSAVYIVLMPFECLWLPCMYMYRVMTMQQLVYFALLLMIFHRSQHDLLLSFIPASSIPYSEKHQFYCRKSHSVASLSWGCYQRKSYTVYKPP